MDQPAHPDPHHTGDCSLINPEECPIVVDRFRFAVLRRWGESGSVSYLRCPLIVSLASGLPQTIQDTYLPKENDRPARMENARFFVSLSTPLSSMLVRPRL